MAFIFLWLQASPVSGRHIRSPRGSQSESLGYKETDFYRSTVGVASFEL